jgi:D-alanyl-D-alanine carboxypeptidase
MQIRLVVTGLLVAAMAVVNPSWHGHAAVQQVLDQAVAGGLPGISAEIRGPDRTWFGTAGVADITTSRQRKPPDRFRIGSTTKTFVATVVLQLVAEHRLRLDDPVERWLPGVVRGNGQDGRRVTIREMLGQTSGIFDYQGDSTLQKQSVGTPFLVHRFDQYTPDQLVRIAMAHPSPFAPGTNWGYSNTNYILLGMLIERITGRSLAQEIALRIARPLGLTGTYLPAATDTSILAPHGRGYSKLLLPDPTPIYDVTELSPSWSWAAGGLISTVGDLTRFFGALLAGTLLPPAEQRAMFTTRPTAGWIPNTTYGLGMSSIALSCGRVVWGMGGAISGSFSYTYGTRDGRTVLAVNVNGDWNNPIGTFTQALEAQFCPAG